MLIRALVLVGPALASVLVGPLLLGIQDSKRDSVVEIEELSDEQVRELSVAELLLRMPAEAWMETSDGWELKAVPAEMGRRAENGLLSDDEWVAALTAADVIHSRPRWPAGERLRAWIKRPAWLSRVRISARAVQPDLGRIQADDTNPSWCGNCQMARSEGYRHLAFEELPSGTRGIDLEITIDQGDAPKGFFAARTNPRKVGGEHGQELYRGTLHLSVEAVSSFEEAMPAVADAATESAVRHSIHASWWRPGDDRNGPALDVFVGGSYDEHPHLRGVAVSLSVELRKHGDPVTKVQLRAWQGVDWNDRLAGMSGWTRISDLPEELTRENVDLEPWDLRVTGTNEETLTLWEADRWWKGSFEMPLSEAIETTDSEPPR